MKGKKVELHLHTPILVEVREEEGGEKPRVEAVTRLTGIVSQFGEEGLLLEVDGWFSEKGHSLILPARVLFLPQHNIDHILLNP